MRKTPETGGKTPAQITVSMIDQDLKDGISKSEMAKKYNIKPWEVDEMFKHPFLKGRRPSRKKALSFTFVDDVSNKREENMRETGTIIDREEVFIDPNQVTLEDAIDEAIESCEQAKESLKEAEAEIVEILSPTEFKTPEEEVAKFINEDRNDLDYANTELNEEELDQEEEDTTFEL